MTPVRKTGTKYRGLNPEGLAPHKFTLMLGVPCNGAGGRVGFEVNAYRAGPLMRTVSISIERRLLAMPSGDSQRAWFPEMLVELESFWTSNVDWRSLIAFCERMTTVRTDIRRLRGIREPMIYCHSCKERHPAKLLDISPRSALFSLQKLGILTEDQMKMLDRDWAKYRKQHDLDAYGKPKSTTTQTSHHCSDDKSDPNLGAVEIGRK